MNYLYIEDDPLSQEIMQVLMLEVVGNEHLTIFPNSEQFMQKLEALDKIPDFIFLDIHLDPLDGYELLKIIRANTKYNATKVIAVTASVMIEEIKNIKNAGFDGSLSKPLDMSSFPSVIQKLESGKTIWQVS